MANRQLQRIERFVRRQFLRALTRLLPTPGVTSPGWGAVPRRVLFLRHDRIGDMIVSTGVLRAIAHSHPWITLDVLGSPENAPVLAAAPWVRTVHQFRRNRPWSWPALAWRLRRARYDAVVDCMVTAPSVTTLLLVLASGARHRVGVAGRGHDRLFTLLVPPAPPDAHMVAQLAALVAAFDLHPALAEVHPTIPLTDAELAEGAAHWPDGTGPRVLVNVSAGKRARHWPDAHYAAGIHHVRRHRHDARVLVIGAPDEQERVRRIAALAGARPVATPDVRAAFALVATAELLLTPDTSLGHAATAFRVPAVVLHRGGTARMWGRHASPGVDVAADHPTLETLPLAPVLAALDQVVIAAGLAATAPPHVGDESRSSSAASGLHQRDVTPAMPAGSGDGSR